MKIEMKYHNLADITIVTLNPGEILQSSMDASTKCYGLYYYYGDCDFVDGYIGPGQKGPLLKWLPSDASTYWLSGDPSITGPFVASAKASPEGACYMCISRNANYSDKVISQIDLNSSYTLPAGSAFVVCDNSATADGVSIPQFGYFSPRTYDVSVTGSGNILVIT